MNDTPSADIVQTHLYNMKQSSDDIDMYVEFLHNLVSGALSPDNITIRYHRSLKEKLSGQTGRFSEFSLNFGSMILRLVRANQHGSPLTTVENIVSGVRLSTQEIPFDHWIELLSQQLAARAESDMNSRNALEQFFFHS